KEEILKNQIFGNKNALKINGQFVRIQKAPEPEDINWNALSCKQSQQFKKRVFSALFTIFLLFSSFSIIYYLMNLQVNFKEQPPFPEEVYKMKMLALTISIVIQILNFLLQKVLNFLSSFEQHYTKTKELSSLSQKLAIVQFINTALIALLIKVLQYQLNNPEKAKSNIYINGGLIYNQQYVFLSSLFFPFIQLADFGRLYKVLKRKIIQKDNLTQAQLNELYEDSVHNIAYDYGGVIKTMYVTAFYAPLIPIGIIISIFNILINYFIQKYLLLTHRSVKYSVSDCISRDMIEQLEHLLPIYCISNALFQYLLKDGQNISNFGYAGIFISAIHVILPMRSFNEFFFYVKKAPDLHETYNENYLNFQFDYDRANPATNQVAKKEFVDGKKQKKVIYQWQSVLLANQKQFQN
ncbi:protein kinase domain protein, partial [Ichthyophthirius multifiliis]